MEISTLDRLGKDEPARLAGTLTRRLVSAPDEFDMRSEDPVELSLDADGQVVHEVTAIRHDLIDTATLLPSTLLPSTLLPSTLVLDSFGMRFECCPAPTGMPGAS